MEFKQAVVTQNGRALMAKLLAGKQTTFTKIKVSSTIYPDAQLANLTALTNIKQEAIAQAYGNNTATVSVVGAIENTDLVTGYYINTVGLYAMDPDKGEILYSVSSASVNGYMPPDTGVSKSGFEFKIYTEVGNAIKVDLTVDPAAFATHEDIERVSTLKTAYSWSADGTDRFTTVYPNENLWIVGKKPGEKLRITKTNNYYVELKTGIKIEPDTTYTFQWQAENVSGNAHESISIGYANQSGLFANEGIYVQISAGKATVKTASVLPENGTHLGIRLNRAEIPQSSVYDYWNLKVEKCDTATIYTPAPSDDYANAYPTYIGLAPGYSEKPEDYVWLPEPTKNQEKLDELVALKDQVADMQSWIQAHS